MDTEIRFKTKTSTYGIVYGVKLLHTRSVQFHTAMSLFALLTDV